MTIMRKHFHGQHSILKIKHQEHALRQKASKLTKKKRGVFGLHTRGEYGQLTWHSFKHLIL